MAFRSAWTRSLISVRRVSSSPPPAWCCCSARGVLSLDDDVRMHLPELLLPVPVTLRQCLSHTGGLREYYSLCELAGVPVAGLDEARVMRLLSGQTGLNFPPGTGWSYSNSGFVLAAAVLRRVSGRSLAEFAADRV